MIEDRRLNDKYKFKYRKSTRFMEYYRTLPFRIPFLNFTIRQILKLHLLQAKVRNNLYFLGKNQGEVDNWYERKNIFFGLASIRCGTTFLADFLNKVVPESVVKHEARPDDYWSFAKSFQDSDESYNYLKNFKRREIYLKMSSIPVENYGEINPFLRRHSRALQEVFPEAKFFRIVRDGRDVVRSMMSRGTFTKREPIASMVKPPVGDPYFKKWNKLSRFEKICWLWADTNKTLRENIDHVIYFEKMLTDFDYFKKEVADFLELPVKKEDWQKAVSKPKHSTVKFKMPKWEDWTVEQKEQFRNICGEEMKENGYAF